MSGLDPWGDEGAGTPVPATPGQPEDPLWPVDPSTSKRRKRNRSIRLLLLIGGPILAFILISEGFNIAQRAINPQNQMTQMVTQEAVEQIPGILSDLTREPEPTTEDTAPAVEAPNAGDSGAVGDSGAAGDSDAADRPDDLASYIDTLLQSVVMVHCLGSGDTLFQGSGFALDVSSLSADAGEVIVTNWHVLEDCPATSPIYVTTSNEVEAEAMMVASDSDGDLAILTVSDFTLPALQPASGYRQGDWVMAAGNPEGITGTTTSGSIANIKADVEEILSDALITFGSSGGPLMNNRGQVIGVTSAILVDGAGFSISRPLSSLCNVILDCR